MSSKFVSTYDTFLSPICNNCVHHISGLQCKAFDRIPDAIISGDNDHSQPLQDQENDLVFQSF